jgi:hypothetical protein
MIVSGRLIAAWRGVDAGASQVPRRPGLDQPASGHARPAAALSIEVEVSLATARKPHDS